MGKHPFIAASSRVQIQASNGTIICIEKVAIRINST
jgi:hypothetical protein